MEEINQELSEEEIKNVSGGAGESAIDHVCPVCGFATRDFDQYKAHFESHRNFGYTEPVKP